MSGTGRGRPGGTKRTRPVDCVKVYKLESRDLMTHLDATCVEMRSGRVAYDEDVLCAEHSPALIPSIGEVWYESILAW